MSMRLARRLDVPEGEMIHIQRGGALHDIGKVAIPDGILFKPGPLTDEEWLIMRRHPSIAVELLSPISYLAPAMVKSSITSRAKFSLGWLFLFC